MSKNMTYKNYVIIVLVLVCCGILGGCFGGGGSENPPVVVVTEPTSTTTTTSSEAATETTAAGSTETTQTAEITTSGGEAVGETGFYEGGVFYQFAKPGGEKLSWNDVKLESEKLGIKIELQGYSSGSRGIEIRRDGELWAVVYSEGMQVFPLGNVSFEYPVQNDNYVYVTRKPVGGSNEYETKLWYISLLGKRPTAVLLGDFAGHDFASFVPASYIVDGDYGYYQRMIVKNPDDEERCIIVYSDFMGDGKQFEVLADNVPKLADGSGYLDFEVEGVKKIKLIGEVGEIGGGVSNGENTESAISKIEGQYRLWGEEGTASAEIAGGIYTAYYGSGAMEFEGRIEQSDESTFIVYVEENGKVYNIEFDAEWNSFTMGDLRFERVK